MKSRDRVNQWIEDNGKLMPDEDRESLIFEFEESAQEQRKACGIMAASAAMHTQSAREVNKACLEAVNVDEILATHAINATGGEAVSLSERIDDMTWPNAGRELDDIEWRMRYGAVSPSSVSAASIIGAYRELLTCTAMKREYIVRELRKRRER